MLGERVYSPGIVQSNFTLPVIITCG